MNLKHIISGVLVTVLVAAALAVYSPASATGTLFAQDGSGVFHCDEVALNFASDYGGTNYLRVLVTPGDTVVSSAVPFTADGTFQPVTIPLAPTQSAGTMLKVQYASDAGGPWYDAYYQTAGQVVGSCVVPEPPDEPTGEDTQETAPEPPPSGLLPYQLIGWEGARLSILVQTDPFTPDNPMLMFYQINEQSEGTLIFYISKKMLSEYPDTPAAPIVIFESDDGKYRFSKLPNGEYEVRVGPDNENKVHLVYFTGVPPQNVHIDSYFVALPDPFAAMVRAFALRF